MWRQSSYVGIRLGVRCRLGFSNIFVRCRCSTAVRQRIGRDLLQRTENCARHTNASLGQVARPARCRSLDYFYNNKQTNKQPTTKNKTKKENSNTKLWEKKNQINLKRKSEKMKRNIHSVNIEILQNENGNKIRSQIRNKTENHNKTFNSLYQPKCKMESNS